MRSCRSVLLAVITAMAVASCGQPAEAPAGPSLAPLPTPASSGEAGASSAAAETGGSGEVAEVALRIGSSTATIRGVDGSGYTVERTVRFADGSTGPEPPESSRLDGTSLVLEGCPQPDCWFDYDVTVPRAVDVVGETGSGAVDIGAITGSVRVESGSGAVQLADVSGEVRLQTGSGAVSGSGLGGPRTEITSGSGAVDLRTATVQSVRVESSSGAVRLVVAPGQYRVAVRSGAATQVEVPNDASASESIDVRSSSGNVAVGVG